MGIKSFIFSHFLVSYSLFLIRNWLMVIEYWKFSSKSLLNHYFPILAFNRDQRSGNNLFNNIFIKQSGDIAQIRDITLGNFPEYPPHNFS